MKFLSWLLYLPLQILLLPLAIIGGALVAYRQLVVSKRLGVSQTAIEIFNGRWTLHIFGMREDPGAAAIGPVLANTSTFGLWLALLPLWLKAKVAGALAIYPRYVPDADAGFADLVPNRTAIFDRILTRQLDRVEQFVMMGAGMDTRAYGALDLRGARVFELDQAATQTLKRETLKKAGVDASHVTFIEVDFSTQDPFERLQEHGYDPNKKTLFLWEGVTLYLSEEAVCETMARIRANVAPGSALVADIYGERMMAFARSQGAKQALEMTGESLMFGMSFAKDWDQELAAFVEDNAYTQGETVFLGSAHNKGPYAVVVELLA